MPEKPADRPARKQVNEPVTGREEVIPTGQVNVWTGRRLREFRTEKTSRGVKNLTAYRCHPKLDEGWTRGERGGNQYCCIYFARGICHHGSDCNFRHRVPTAADEARHAADFSNDIFGRDRRADDSATKDVGSYSRVTTTLYMFLGAAATQPQELLEKLVREGFSEWGPLEDVRVIPSKAIAFVRYQWRASAEFAKAAMHQQSLSPELSAPLDVRWAHDDPNPNARDRVKREREGAFVSAYMRAMDEMDPEAKRAKLYQLQLDAGYKPGSVAAAYPDTDTPPQFNDDNDDDNDGTGVKYPEMDTRDALGLNVQGYPEVEEDEDEDDENAYLNEDEIEELWQQEQQQRKKQEEESGGGPRVVNNNTTNIEKQPEKPEKGAPAANDGDDNAVEQALGLVCGYGSDSE